MPPEEKHKELKKYLEIVLATIDYSFSRESKRFIADDEDLIPFHFENQRSQARKYFNEKKLASLKKKLERLYKTIPENDFEFENYIKERTGYQLGRFNDLKKRVAVIVDKNEINSNKELDDIITMLQYYEVTSPGCEEIQRFKKMAGNYLKKPEVISGINKRGRSVVLNRKQEGDVIIERVVHFNGLKPKHVEFKEVTSPNGNRSVEITQWKDKHSATTGVRIVFPSTSGHVYIVEGIHSQINAHWKNNNTLIIETLKEFNVTLQHSKVKSGKEIIKIEYNYF